MVSDDNVGNLWLAQALWDVGAVKFGDFTIGRTTEHSPIYVNLRLLISNPAALARAAGVMLEEIQTLQAKRDPDVQEYHAYAASRSGAAPCDGVSAAMRVPLIYGTQRRSATAAVCSSRACNAGRDRLLIDDLVTSGAESLRRGNS